MSYSTVAEADEYILSHYLPTEQVYAYWMTLSNPSKQVLLTRAFDKIEILPFTGRKATLTQTTQFPRLRQLEVPQVVKTAEVVEAITSGFPGNAQQQSLRMRGVTSYTIGHLSETFADVGLSAPGDPRKNVCPEVLILLADYLGGGHSIKW